MPKGIIGSAAERREHALNSLPPLTSEEIGRFFEDYVADSVNWGGCHSRDNIPDLESGATIINMESADRGGSHWCLLYKDLSHNRVYYIDPYGMPPPQEAIVALEQTGLPIVISDFRLQADWSTSCGWWCVALARFLNRGKTLGYIIFHRFSKPADRSKKGVNPAYTERSLRNLFDDSEIASSIRAERAATEARPAE